MKMLPEVGVAFILRTRRADHDHNALTRFRQLDPDNSAAQHIKGCFSRLADDSPHGFSLTALAP